MSKEVTGRLENWTYDVMYNVIWGDIYNDIRGRFGDGTNIHTSDIPGGRRMEFKEGDIVKTLNSSYLLGEPKVMITYFKEYELDK